MPGIVTAELTYGDTKWHEGRTAVHKIAYVTSCSLPVYFSQTMALSMTGAQRIDCLGSNKSLSHGKQKYFVLYPSDIFQKGTV